MDPYIAVIALLLVMGATVLATMVIENWRHLVVPAPVAVVDDAPAPERRVTDDSTHTDDSTCTDDRAHTEVVVTDPVAGPLAGSAVGDAEARSRASAGVPEGALSVVDGTLLLRDPETVDALCAVLFGGLGSTRRTGADRAAAWVTAVATPPSADPTRFPPGVRLRGRSAKVAELLAHHDGGRVWVTMQPDVDIARGLARTPELPPTLSGLVTWWRAVQDLPAVLGPDRTAEIADAIERIRPRTDTTAFSRVVGELHDALAAAATAREPLVVAIGGGATGIGDGDAAIRSDRGTPEPSIRSGPSRAAPSS